MGRLRVLSLGLPDDMDESAAHDPRHALPKVQFSALRVIRGLVAAYLGVLLLLMIFEESLIFFPMPYPAGDWKPAGLNVEDAWFTAADGTRLHGWYLEHERPRAVLLIAHGNAGNLSHRADWLDELHDRLQTSVMIFDYRGYGRSEGKPNEQGVLADARAARAWLAERAGVNESEIVLVGESIGGAVMTVLAGEDGARGLIIENTFSSLPDVAAFHYPWLPVRLAMHSRLDAAGAVKNYRGRLLQFHGDRDTIVPFALGQKLSQAANQPKEFIVLPGGDHNDPRAEVYYRAVDRFLDQLSGGS